MPTEFYHPKTPQEANRTKHERKLRPALICGSTDGPTCPICGIRQALCFLKEEEFNKCDICQNDFYFEIAEKTVLVFVTSTEGPECLPIGVTIQTDPTT